ALGLLTATCTTDVWSRPSDRVNPPVKKGTWQGRASVGHQPRRAMPKGLADHTSPTVSISAVRVIRKGWDAIVKSQFGFLEAVDELSLTWGSCSKSQHALFYKKVERKAL
uniref:Uncharacterized protein n=1 Tax=Anas platyrhynchos platyrhynchos TaxID=8840 RepID=A0A493T1I7_ANAPP